MAARNCINNGLVKHSTHFAEGAAAPGKHPVSRYHKTMSDAQLLYPSNIRTIPHFNRQQTTTEDCTRDLRLSQLDTCTKYWPKWLLLGLSLKIFNITVDRTASLLLSGRCRAFPIGGSAICCQMIYETLDTLSPVLEAA